MHNVNKQLQCKKIYKTQLPIFRDLKYKKNKYRKNKNKITREETNLVPTK